MNESAHEQLSALMDGELQRDELRFLLRGLDRDTGLARRWSRYQVARAVLQRQYVPGATGDDRFAMAVMSRLEQDRAEPRRFARVGRWAGGGAIAAAVALVALMATRPAGDNGALPAVTADMVAAAPSSILPQSLLLPQSPAGQVQLRQPVFVPQPAIPATFADAQPASFESSFVPRYAGTPRNPAPAADASPNGFVPYVLMVGSRPKPEATAGQDASAVQQ
jgi:sigma-E factor negative regulatory protein RseA